MADIFEMHSAVERFDMAAQDPPQFSQLELLDILHTRLQAEGLALEDLPDPSDSAQFNAVLAELGFNTALERMAIRKAVKELPARQQVVPRLAWCDPSRPVSPPSSMFRVPHRIEVDSFSETTSPLRGRSRRTSLRSTGGRASPAAGCGVPAESPMTLTPTTTRASTICADAGEASSEGGGRGPSVQVLPASRRGKSRDLGLLKSDSGSLRRPGHCHSPAPKPPSASTSGTESTEGTEADYGRALARVMQRATAARRRTAPQQQVGAGPLPAPSGAAAEDGPERVGRHSSPQKCKPWRQAMPHLAPGSPVCRSPSNRIQVPRSQTSSPPPPGAVGVGHSVVFGVPPGAGRGASIMAGAPAAAAAAGVSPLLRASSPTMHARPPLLPPADARPAPGATAAAAPQQVPLLRAAATAVTATAASLPPGHHPAGFMIFPLVTVPTVVAAASMAAATAPAAAPAVAAGGSVLGTAMPVLGRSFCINTVPGQAAPASALVKPATATAPSPAGLGGCSAAVASGPPASSITTATAVAGSSLTVAPPPGGGAAPFGVSSSTLVASMQATAGQGKQLTARGSSPAAPLRRACSPVAGEAGVYAAYGGA